jgi:hypothetical protein
MIPTCRWDYLITKRPAKLYQKVLRYNKHLPQSSRIKDKYTKISTFPIYQQWTDWERI